MYLTYFLSTAELHHILGYAFDTTGDTSKTVGRWLVSKTLRFPVFGVACLPFEDWNEVT